MIDEDEIGAVCEAVLRREVRNEVAGFAAEKSDPSSDTGVLMKFGGNTLKRDQKED